MSNLPQPIPYQGSKRKLCPVILNYFPKGINTLYEPFAGSAAVTIASADERLVKNYVIGEKFEPLAGIWKLIINEPKKLADDYKSIWDKQIGNEKDHYIKIRDDFNKEKDPAKLLYLICRCVKNSVRFNSKNEFNQSADNRRKGVLPSTMKKRILKVHELLSNKTSVVVGDYRKTIEHATEDDIVYMDPPYQGTSGKKDTRYRQKK